MTAKVKSYLKLPKFPVDMLQQTVKNHIYLEGLEPYGGNLVKIAIEPAGLDNGIVFRTSRGNVPAELEYALPSRNSILLTTGEVKVTNVEHMLATLFAYGVDNAYVDVERVPSRSFRHLERIGLATAVEALPNFNDREKALCDKLEETGLEQQDNGRRIVRLQRAVGNDYLKFEPIDGDALIAHATTVYPVPGEQSVTLEVNAANYRDQLSKSRPYAKEAPHWIPRGVAGFLASLWYPGFGYGHGHTTSTVFLPVGAKRLHRKEKRRAIAAARWEMQEIDGYDAEIARHSIVDRLGAISLLPGRLEGARVTMKFSNHSNDLKVLREEVMPNLV
jgi:UDP-3-O-acyl-N-acetylglucosamine deacetylase